LTEQPGPLHEVIGLGFGDAVNVRAWSFDNRILKHNTLEIVLFKPFVR
jgi:hypothetical protein